LCCVDSGISICETALLLQHIFTLILWSEIMPNLDAEKTEKPKREKSKIRGEAAIAKFVKLINSVHADDVDAFYDYLSKRWFNGGKVKH
jgi:hypothetical protein